MGKMKKITLFIAVFVLLGVGFYVFSKITADSEEKYPYIMPRDNPSFTQEMLEKYPELSNKYKNVYLYHGNPFEVKSNEKGLFGVYDKKTGELIIPHKYSSIQQGGGEFCMFFIAKEKNVSKILDYRNEVVFEMKNATMEPNWLCVLIRTPNGVSVVSYAGIRLKGPYDEIIPQRHYGEFGGIYYIVRKKDKYGVYDNNLKKIIPMSKRVIEPMNGPFFHLRTKNGIGVIDMFNKVIVEPKYTLVEQKGSLAEDYYFKVCDEKSCGVINTNGGENLLLNSEQDVEKLSSNRYAVGTQQKGMRIVDENGNPVSDNVFPFLKPFSGTKYVYIHGDGLGVADIDGNIIMQYMHGISNIERVTENELIKVMGNGKYGVVYKNELIAPVIYKKVYFYRGYVLLLTEDNFYYVSSYSDFAKNKGNLSKCKKYPRHQYKKVDDDCFKFVKDDGKEDLYCKK